ncbi:SMI1/KNR4 family protein [Microtetraspora malaysiensis]|uniref:SMI1/KNR4 family protein n=1 Tax=Microtetraspora malaysiensis TaxID=161358 RepID=A0ABW6SI28_9ACTN
MRRLIPSRLIRLALAAAVAATIVGAVFLLFRRRADPASGGVPGRASGHAADGAIGGLARPDQSRPAPRRGGEPRTGTAEVASFPPEPVRSRRRLHRLVGAAVVVCLLALGVRYVEATTFHEDPLTSAGARHPDSAPCVGDGCLGSGVGAVTSATDGADPENHVQPEEKPDPACAPTVGRPVVRPVRPRVTRAVNRQWRRIERWLKANAPRTFRTLRPPARAGTIAVAEAQMGVRFPDDLRASLLRHNGSRVTPETGGLRLYRYGMSGVKEIRDTWRHLCRQEGVDYTDDPRDEWWSGRMIPVGDDQNGEYLLVDSVRRDVAGSIAENGGTFTGGPGWTSYYALLRTVADALVSGQPIKGRLAPQVTDGALGWVDVDDRETGNPGVTVGTTP